MGSMFIIDVKQKDSLIWEYMTAGALSLRALLDMLESNEIVVEYTIRTTENIRDSQPFNLRNPFFFGAWDGYDKFVHYYEWKVD